MAGTDYPPALLQAFAARLACNFQAMVYFAVSLGLLISVFIAFHLIRVLAARISTTSSTSSFAAPFVKTSRVLRRVLVRKVPLLPSAGHAWLTILYLGLNLVLTFTPLLEHTMLSFQTNVASRTGWLSMGNICVAVFLGLKNTPLGFLTTWSYERLNVLHRIVGYTAMAQCIIHASAYSSYFIALGNMARLRVAEEIYGMVAGFAMLTMVVVAFAIRRRCYEIFYGIHISFFIITMVFSGLHQPESSKRMIYAVMAVCGIWVLDRIIRFVRLVMYSVNNSVTVHPLPHGGTRITLQKAPAGARSGKHCFIWIPKIRTWEMHPFTIANVNPLEFVVASYDGFTRDLHEYATANPGATLRASVEGSYGKSPNPIVYDKVVLIAGGSGASFAVGMAMDMLKHVKTDTRPSVTFVWAVRYQDHLEWFSGHLMTIHHALGASVRLCVTGAASPARNPEDPVESASPVRRKETVTSTSSSDTLNFSVDKMESKAIEKPRSTSLVPSRILTRQLSDPEKSGSDCEPVSPVELYPVLPSDTGISFIQPPQATIRPGMSLHGLQIQYTRPDVCSIISEAVESTPPDKRVLVMGCGPDGLMKQVRNATASQIRTSGPAVELHCEQFGW